MVSQKNYQNIIFDEFAESKIGIFFGIRKQSSELVRQHFKSADLFPPRNLHIQLERDSVTGQKGEIFRLSTKNLWQIMLPRNNRSFTIPRSSECHLPTNLSSNASVTIEN